MTREFFAEQIARLRTEWQSAYGKERMEVLYRAFQWIRDEVFRDAVDELLADHKGGAPMRKDLDQAVNNAAARFQANEAYRGGRYRSDAPDGAMPPMEKVREICRQVIEGKIVRDDKPDYVERDRRRMAQLRLLSPQDRAANDTGDE